MKYRQKEQNINKIANKKANDKDAAKSNDNLRTTFPPFLR